MFIFEYWFQIIRYPINSTFLALWNLATYTRTAHSSSKVTGYKNAFCTLRNIVQFIFSIGLPYDTMLSTESEPVYVGGTSLRVLSLPLPQNSQALGYLLLLSQNSQTLGYPYHRSLMHLDTPHSVTLSKNL